MAARGASARARRHDSELGEVQRTSVGEQTDDAAALLEALGAAPAVVIGRSYGGTVAVDLAVRYPRLVRALVLLEPDASRELAPAAVAWAESVTQRLRRVAASLGVDAVPEALITAVAGEGAWASFPDEVRRTLSANGPAILAELEGGWWLDADTAAIAEIKQPTLVVMAADSPPEFHRAPEALAKTIANARLSQVVGGHFIDPAAPEVIAFVERALAEPVGP